MEAPESGLSTSSVASDAMHSKREINQGAEGKARGNRDASKLDKDPNNMEKKSFKFKLTVFMICLISVVVAMDSVIVASTLPAITVALKGTSLEAFWVGTSYLLAQTVSIPFLYLQISKLMFTR
jgi:predicted tellurium resistance membrane protein TerC